MLCTRPASSPLPSSASRFRTALLSYTYAVDLEARARAEWERADRPFVQVHGAAGVHPLVKIMLETSRSTAFHGAQLGMDPASAKRINPHRRPGRPVGANSSPDRRALPGVLMRDGSYAEPTRLRLAEGPGAKVAQVAAAVNRARGHPVDG